MTSKAKDNSWNFKGATYLRRKKTQYVSVSFYADDISAYEFGKMMVAKGWFNTGYHYIVHPDGTIETGIPLDQYGDPTIKGYNDSICILAVGVSDAKKKDWLRFVFPLLREKMNLTLPLKQEG